mmetsp:Transcript_16529/g.29783  ORF Transcript_16529/g.29783 Transcript_16529/m.29783 type:complete len:253 (+) Transcript_16529:48-806(+)
MFDPKDLKGFLNDTTAESIASETVTTPAESLELPLQEEQSCKICNVKFNILFGIKRFHCKFCGCSVCANHSLRRRQRGTEMLRICDLCEEDSIKNELKSELVTEIWNLQKELEAAQKESDRQQADEIRQRNEIRRSEEELESRKLFHRQQLDELKQRLERECLEGNRLKDKVDELKGQITKHTAEEQKVVVKTQLRKADLEKLQADNSMRSQELKLLTSQENILEEQLSDRLSVQLLYNILCDDCLNAVVEL